MMGENEREFYVCVCVCALALYVHFYNEARCGSTGTSGADSPRAMFEVRELFMA